jgi:radical SAM-linked protein
MWYLGILQFYLLAALVYALMYTVMGVQFRGHDPEMSLLEAAFARGDENLSRLIEEAWRLGCRLDAWTEYFDMTKWKQAMDNTGIYAADFAEREIRADAQLPWENIESGVTKEYLWKEYQKALSVEYTSDCRKVCHACGLKCRPEDMAEETAVDLSSRADQKADRSFPVAGATMKVRLRYAKIGRLRYLSHLETTTALIRGMRRAGFPFKYTEGFHPGPRVSFGPALSVGTAGLKEYLDMELIQPFDIMAGLLLLQEYLPRDLQALTMKTIEKGAKSLTGFVVRYSYEIIGKKGLFLDAFLENRHKLIQRKQNSFRISEMVEEAVKTGDTSSLITVKDLGDIKVRLDELLPLIFGQPADDLEITRIAMYGWDNGWKEPLED